MGMGGLGVMWRTRLVTSLVLAAGGFLVGIYWSVLSSLIKPFASDFAARWVEAEEYVEKHPLEAGLLFAVIGVMIEPTCRWWRNFAAHLFRRRSIIDLIFKKEKYVYIVTSHMRQTSFERIGDKQTMQLPKNAPFLPSNVAIGAALVYSYVHDRYAGKKTALLHFDNENWGADDNNYISIGGPFVNKIVKDVLDANLVPDFRITNVPTAIDQTIVYEAEREKQSTQPDAPLAIDYGFLIYMKNPANNKKRICIAFGLWPAGSQAAVSAILNPGKRSNPHVKQLCKSIRRDDNVIGIIRVKIRGLMLEEGELVKVRHF
jgi:hypothetical protein